jgi:predicted porin
MSKNQEPRNKRRAAGGRLLVYCGALAVFCAGDASAWEYNRNRIGIRLNGHASAGAFAAEGLEGGDYFAGDFRLRGQLNYAAKAGWTTGLVMSADRLAFDSGHYARDAFAFAESPYGRIELGQTDSIASKLGVGLPDVGGLRMNDYNLAYDAFAPNGAAISNPAGGGARYAFRANVVSAPTNPIQFGASFAPFSQTFKYAADAGLKYRRPHGKTKIAVSVGATFVDAPDGMSGDIYAPRVYADWRAAVSGGLNVQYNSWNFGAFARGIYDRNPIGAASDGISGGAGASYDFLKFSASASYIVSDTGIFHKGDDRPNHIGVLSGRYKFNKWIDAWVSAGAARTDKTHPFASAGLRAAF